MDAAPAGSSSRIDRSPAATYSTLVGSQTVPRAPPGLSITILLMVGKSLARTGVPAAKHSKSLFGLENRSFSVEPGFGIAPTSADATHEMSAAGATGSSTWRRPRHLGSRAAAEYA